MEGVERPYKNLGMILVTQLNFLLFRMRVWTEIPHNVINQKLAVG